MKRRRIEKIRKNPSALIASVLILISGFLFPLFNTSLFGETIANKKNTIVNLILNIPNSTINSLESILFLILLILFLAIFFLYLLNGMGIMFNRYSRYASYISFAYLIVGLSLYSILNSNNVSLLGVELAGVSIGAGIYLIPIIGGLYILFNRSINSNIRI
jgi:hypothetical protein